MKVIVSPTLSKGYDRRYVVVDEATGDVLDDAQGYGYKTAQKAHRAYSYKSMPPERKSQRTAVKSCRALVCPACAVHAAG